MLASADARSRVGGRVVAPRVGVGLGGGTSAPGPLSVAAVEWKVGRAARSRVGGCACAVLWGRALRRRGAGAERGL